MADGPPPPLIRKYRPDDRQSVRDICARTCWMGEHRPELIGDDWLWAEFWTRYFTDVESDLTWVVVRHGHFSEPCDSAMLGPQDRVFGYLTGTADCSRFDHYGYRLLPRIVWHVIRRRLMRRRQSRRAILQLARAMLANDTALPRELRRQFPATCHIDLLPPARQRGVGSTMLQYFLDDLAARGVPGVHAQTLNLNLAAGKSLARAGFTLALTRPTAAFRLVHDGPVEVQTWTRKIDG